MNRSVLKQKLFAGFGDPNNILDQQLPNISSTTPKKFSNYPEFNIIRTSQEKAVKKDNFMVSAIKGFFGFWKRIFLPIWEFLSKIAHEIFKIFGFLFSPRQNSGR